MIRHEGYISFKEAERKYSVHGFKVVNIAIDFDGTYSILRIKYACKVCDEVTERPQCHPYHDGLRAQMIPYNIETNFEELSKKIYESLHKAMNVPILFSERYGLKKPEFVNLNSIIKMTKTTKNSAKTDAKIARGIELQKAIHQKREEKKKVELMLTEGSTRVEFVNRRLDASIGSCSLPQEGVNHLLSEVVKGLDVTIKELEKEYENL